MKTIMKGMAFYFVIVSIVLCSFLNYKVYAACVESGGGQITYGSMDQGLFLDTLGVLKSQGSGSYLFVVQKNSGYYIKICDDQDQIQHFMDVYASGSGGWHCQTLCGGDINRYYSAQGVFRIKVVGGCWKVCQYY